MTILSTKCVVSQCRQARVFCQLQDKFTAAEGTSSDGQQQRMNDYLGFAHRLQHVASVWTVGPGGTLRQVRNCVETMM